MMRERCVEGSEVDNVYNLLVTVCLYALFARTDVPVA